MGVDGGKYNIAGFEKTYLYENSGLHYSIDD